MTEVGFSFLDDENSEVGLPATIASFKSVEHVRRR